MERLFQSSLIVIDIIINLPMMEYGLQFYYVYSVVFILLFFCDESVLALIVSTLLFPFKTVQSSFEVQGTVPMDEEDKTLNQVYFNAKILLMLLMLPVFKNSDMCKIHVVPTSVISFSLNIIIQINCHRIVT